MAPAPSERLDHDGIVPHLVVGTPHRLRGLSLRSHLHDGRCVAWDGPQDGSTIAVDAEVDRPVPRALGSRFGVDDFWGRWTRLECAAKATDTPVALLLGPSLGLPAVPGARFVTIRLAGRGIVSVALREPG